MTIRILIFNVKKNINLTGGKMFVAGQYSKERDFWMDKLSGELLKTSFPYDYKGKVNDWGEQGKDTENFKYTGKVFSRLVKVSNDWDLRLYMLLLAGLLVLLKKYTGNNDIIVAAPALKQNVEAKFINTVLVLRNRLDDSKTFKELLYQVKNTIIEAAENVNYPLETLFYQLNIPLPGDEASLIDVVILLENIHDRKYIEHINSNIIFSFMRTDKYIEGIVEYNRKRYDKTTIKRIIKHFNHLMYEVIFEVDVRLSDITILSELEKKQLLFDFNDTGAPYPDHKTIQELFEQQVIKTPGNMAIVYEDKKLSYKELNEISNQLARILREKGVKAETLVGIMVTFSIEMIVGIMGTLKAGAAYIPIDPEYPLERINYMLEDCDTGILLIKHELINEIEFEGKIIDLEDDKIYRGDGLNPERINASNNPAYVIYTSGSTGKPKGVLIEHKNIINYILWRIKEYNQTSADVSLQLVSFSFDGFCANFYPTVLSGGALVLLNEDQWTDASHIRNKIREEEITNFSLVPSLYKIILEGAKREDFASVRLVVLAGEKANKPLIELSNKIMPAIKLINEYGPSENSVTSAASCGMTSENVSLIGIPIFNNQVLMLDENKNLKPIGLTGELWISGQGLARGYLNMPQLTEEKFISNPYIPEEKMFGTGDLARWLTDGNIEFLGRIDQQVKIRGFRIELGEIENYLLMHAEIKEAIVVTRENDKGEQYICAYYVCERPLTIKTLRDYLSKGLPGYMIPSRFVQLDKIPLTPNGKLDRKLLPEPGQKVSSDTVYETPGNEIEKLLVDIWKEELAVEKIGINDNFFELGGYSLKAIIVLSKIHKSLNAEVPLKELFVRPTIKELAVYITGLKASIYSPIKKLEKAAYYPLSSAQKRLLIVNQLKRESLDYNMPGIYMFEGRLDKIKFEIIFKQLIERHEAFRTSFHSINGEAVQKIEDKTNFKITFDKYSEEKAKTRIKEFVRPFDLNYAPLLRIELIQMHDKKHFVLFDMHHIIFDGFSMDILLKEFVDLYEGMSLDPLPIQYKDYAAWQQKLLGEEKIKKQEKYWLKKMNDFIFTQLPIDNFNSYMRVEGGVENMSINKSLYKKIEEYCNSQGVTRFMLFLSIFQIILAREMNQKDITIGIPIANRDHPDIKNTIGFFLNLLLIRSNINTDESFLQNLSNTKTDVIEAMDNSSYPYELLDYQIRKNRNFKRGELFTILVDYFPTKPKNEILKDKFKITPYSSEVISPKYDVIFYILDSQEEMGLSIVYKSNLFKKYRIKRILNNFMHVMALIMEKEKINIYEINMLDNF
jgi:amino acid adenylation domain-containing protein